MELGQARYWLMVVQLPIVIPSVSLAANPMLPACVLCHLFNVPIV